MIHKNEAATDQAWPTMPKVFTEHVMCGVAGGRTVSSLAGALVHAQG